MSTADTTIKAIPRSVYDDKAHPPEDLIQSAMRTGDWTGTGLQPKAACKKCYGRGHVGKHDRTKKFVPCVCLRPIKRQ